MKILARNIQALNFDYFDADGNNLSNKMVAPYTVPAARIPDIRTIQISMVARPLAIDTSGSGWRIWQRSNFMDSKIYRNRSGNTILGAQNDPLHRMQATTEIDCRNLGI